MNILLNVAIYQLVWFLCVLGETRGAWLGLLLLGLHLFLSPIRRQDLKMMGILLVVGLGIDGVLHTLGFFSFNVAARPIPFWLLVIWLALAILPHHSLAWLKSRPFLSAFFGALGGPLAYWAGVRLGVAHFNWSLPSSLGTLAIVWALLWPAVMYLAAMDYAPQSKTNEIND
jgi:hypothetical protein